MSSLNDQLVWGAPWLSIRLRFLVLLFSLAAPSPCSFRVLVGGPLQGGVKHILFYKLKFIFMLYKLGIRIFQSIKQIDRFFPTSSHAKIQTSSVKVLRGGVFGR